MELDIFFLREKVLNKSLMIQHIPALDQNVDILTKPVSSLRFLAMRDKLRWLISSPSLNHLEFKGRYIKDIHIFISFVILFSSL